MDEISREIRRLAGFDWFKNLSEEERVKRATQVIADRKARQAAKPKVVKVPTPLDDFDIQSKFSDKEEQSIAKELAGKYLNDYTIETISERNTLKEIIFLEVVQTRLQNKLNEFHATGNKTIPTQLVDVIHRNTEAILRLKESLGLGKRDASNTYNVLEHLKKRFKKHREENQGSRTLICPHCSKMVMLKIKTDAWDAQKHPLFKDRILYNEHLIALYKSGKITKEDVAKVLETSQEYVDWILEKAETSTSLATEPANGN